MIFPLWSQDDNDLSLELPAATVPVFGDDRIMQKEAETGVERGRREFR